MKRLAASVFPAGLIAGQAFNGPATERFGVYLIRRIKMARLHTGSVVRVVGFDRQLIVLTDDGPTMRLRIQGGTAEYTVRHTAVHRV